MFSSGDVAGLVLVYAYVSLVISLAAWVRKCRPDFDYRKLIHILVGNIVFIWWVFDDRWTMGLLAALPFVFLLLMMTPMSPIKRFSGSFLDEATGQGHGYGLVYYAVSWTILAIALFDNRMVGGIAIAAMSFGDGIGGLLGKRYGRKKLYRNKSYIGTMSAFLGTTLSALAIMAFYTYLGGYLPQLGVPDMTLMMAVAVATLAGVFVAILELFSPGEYDNLIVPLGTAALLLLVGL